MLSMRPDPEIRVQKSPFPQADGGFRRGERRLSDAPLPHAGRPGHGDLPG